jgi:osmotically-inducible protein OsmY
MLRMNHILNKNFGSSDERLKARILSKLQWDARVSLSDVRLVVRDRKVTVVGDFDREFRRKAVITTIKDFPGVREIIDQTSVRKFFVRTDDELQRLIEKEIEQIPLEGTSCSISVEVIDGSANFFGHVREPRIKALASRLAWELSGVRDCNNMIRVVSAEKPAVHAAIPNTLHEPMPGLAI